MKESQEHYVFTGNSPNDEPMFSFFKNSVGVVNICVFEEMPTIKPGYVTVEPGGAGFSQMAACLLAARQTDVED